MEEGFQDGDEDLIFNEYAVDDTLDPLNRLIKYHTSEFSLQRLVLIRELVDTAKFAGFQQTKNTILPLIKNFTEDTEPAVRVTFVQQLFTLAQYSVESGGDEGVRLLIEVFLPYAFELLVDKNVEVSHFALNSLIQLADLVPAAQIENQLLHVVMTLAHEDRAEDYRVVAAQLFNDLAPKFGVDLCRNSVVAEVKVLSTDLTFTVRKAVAGNLDKIAQVVGTEVADSKILPIFLNLVKDDSWSVRKSCAESCYAISEAISSDARVQYLSAAFKSLSEDNSRWVRVAAFSNLGKFIHTMKREEISPMFLKMFTDMAFQSESGDTDLAEHCAFSFPAVAQAIGRERWKELDDAFNTLLKDAQWRVRRSLAYSLHEIAHVVGRDIAERSLCRVFELFLKDLDEVKLGVILNVDKFFEVLDLSTREKYVPYICNVPIESEIWRLRNVVASKLGDIVGLVSAKAAAGPIADITMKLLDDSVAEVRSSTYHTCAQILLHIQDSPECEAFTAQVLSIAKRPTFQGRQMFVSVFHQVIENGGFKFALEHKLMDAFTQLASDNVANVRYVVARVLANGCTNNPEVCNDPNIQNIVKILSKDPEPDIAAMATAKIPRVKRQKQAASYYCT